MVHFCGYDKQFFFKSARLGNCRFILILTMLKESFYSIWWRDASFIIIFFNEKSTIPCEKN